MGRVAKRCRCCGTSHHGNSWQLCLDCQHAGCTPQVADGDQLTRNVSADVVLAPCTWCGSQPQQRCRNPRTGEEMPRHWHSRRAKAYRERAWCRRLWPNGWRFTPR